MLDRTVLYPGVRETLDRLQDFRLAVLTNKPVHFSCSMLDGLGIYRYFSAVYGGNSFESKKPNPVGIFQILSDTRGHREKTWMIVDSSVDVLTGRNAGVITCGVTCASTKHTATLRKLSSGSPFAHFWSEHKSAMIRFFRVCRKSDNAESQITRATASVNFADEVGGELSIAVFNLKPYFEENGVAKPKFAGTSSRMAHYRRRMSRPV
jgi:hypothetical protein